MPHNEGQKLDIFWKKRFIATTDLTLPDVAGGALHPWDLLCSPGTWAWEQDIYIDIATYWKNQAILWKVIKSTRAIQVEPCQMAVSGKSWVQEMRARSWLIIFVLTFLAVDWGSEQWVNWPIKRRWEQEVNRLYFFWQSWQLTGQVERPINKRWEQDWLITTVLTLLDADWAREQLLNWPIIRSKNWAVNFCGNTWQWTGGESSQKISKTKKIRTWTRLIIFVITLLTVDWEESNQSTGQSRGDTRHCGQTRIQPMRFDTKGFLIDFLIC